MSGYFATAILELLMLSVIAATVGTLIVLCKRSFFAVALSHATFPGGVIAAIIGVNVLIGQAVAALVLATLMAMLSRVKDQGTQVGTGVVLTFGFALGALLTSLQSGSSVPVDALLGGQVFGVGPVDLWVTGAVAAVSVMVLWAARRTLLLSVFDPAAHRAYGFGGLLPEVVTALLISAAMVAAMPAVGAILGVAMVVGPAATASLLARNISHIPPIAFVVGVTAGGLGLWASSAFSIAAGGAIGLAVLALFLLAYGLRALLRSGRGARISAA